MLKKLLYYVFNYTIFCISIYYFTAYTINMNIVNNVHIDLYYILIILLVLLVLFIKYIRILSIVMYVNIKNERIIKTYLKTVFVLICLPFKLGDIYRIYAFSKETKSFYKGLFTVIIDRFFDLFGLLVVFFIFHIINNGIIINDKLILFLLVIFIFFLLLYISYDKTSSAYRKYIITHIHNKKVIAILKYIDMLNRVYKYVNNIVKDRGIFLCTLSITAWFFEYYAIYLTINKLGYSSAIYSENNYISILFYGNDIPFYVYSSFQFTLLFMLLLCIYFYYNILKKKRKINEKCCINL